MKSKLHLCNQRPHRELVLLLILVLAVANIVTGLSLISPDSGSQTLEAKAENDIRDQVTDNSTQEKEARAREEVISKRSKYTKTYLNSDGTYTAEISSAPIHYYNNDEEEWKDISLIAERTEDGKLIINKNTVRVSAGDDLKTEDIFELGKFWIENGTEQQWIEIGIPLNRVKNVNINSIPKEKKPGELFWEELYPGVDFRLIVNEKGRIRESFILKDKESLKNWNGELVIKSNLDVEASYNSIVFKESQEVLFYFSEPYLKSNYTDEEKNEYNFDVINYELGKEAENIYLLKKNISEQGRDWIEKEFDQGTLNVEIDPILELQPDATDGYDNMQLREPNPTYNYGADAGPSHGNWLGRWNSGADFARHLIKFTGLSAIPSGSTVDSATLAYVPWYTSYNGFRQTFVYPVLRDWGEGTKDHAAATDGESSWSYYAYPSTWTTAGCGGAGTDYDNTVVDNTTGLTPNANPLTFTVTNCVQHIVDGATNYGWIIKSEESSSDPGTSNITGYYSSDHGTAAQRPKLVVNYTPPVVVPTVTTQAVDNIGTTTATGHGTVTATGGENPDHRYIEWGTTTSYGSQCDAGTGGTGAYSCGITGLSSGTLYHARAKAHNSAGYGYGGDVTFTTNTPPIASSVSIDSGATSITLTENGTKNVVCASTVTDDDGYGDIESVETKLYRSGVGPDASDDKNNHYTLTWPASCTRSNQSGTTADFSCTFSVYYFADGTDDDSIYPTENWNCKIIPSDGQGEGTAATDPDGIEMNTLLALDVTSPVNYGNMDLGETTASNQTANITNTGNVRIDVEFDGYGATNGDGKALDCATGYIPLANEKYDISDVSYASLSYILTDTAVEKDWDILQRTNESNPVQGEDKKYNYWGLKIPDSGCGGACLGYINFGAVNDKEAD